MIDHFVGAEFFRLRELRLRTSRGDHSCTGVFCKLDRGAAHSASRSKNKYGLSWLQVRAADEHMPRGEKNEWHGGRFLKRKLPGNRQHVHRRRFHEFSATAIYSLSEERILAAEIVPSRETLRAGAVGNPGLQQNSRAHFHIRDFFADLRDFARDVAPGNKRQRNSRNPSPHPEIEMIQGARSNAHENFVRTDLRLRDLGIPQHFQPAMLGENDRLHQHPPVKLRRAETTTRALAVYSLRGWIHLCATAGAGTRPP
jgi:hypothetical protein